MLTKKIGDFCGQSCVEILDNDKQVLKLQVNKNKFLAHLRDRKP